MMRTICALTVCLVALAHADRVRACSCVQPTLARVVVPADGARDFPIDGTLRVFLSGFPAGVRATLGAEYRLRDATGALI